MNMIEQVQQQATKLILAIMLAALKNRRLRGELIKISVADIVVLKLQI